jgi:hypothetical protein
MNPDSVTVGYLEGVEKLLGKPVVAAELFSTIDELLGDGRTASVAVRS